MALKKSRIDFCFDVSYCRYTSISFDYNCVTNWCNSGCCLVDNRCNWRTNSNASHNEGSQIISSSNCKSSLEFLSIIRIFSLGSSGSLIVGSSVYDLTEWILQFTLELLVSRTHVTIKVFLFSSQHIRQDTETREICRISILDAINHAPHLWSDFFLLETQILTKYHEWVRKNTDLSRRAITSSLSIHSLSLSLFLYRTN